MIGKRRERVRVRPDRGLRVVVVSMGNINKERDRKSAMG
jgi:hypothetical protein